MAPSINGFHHTVDDNVDNEDILSDMIGSLSDRSESAYAEFTKIDALKEILSSK